MAEASFSRITVDLRVAEKLVLGFLAYAAFGSIVFSLSTRERLTVIGLNLITSSVVLLLNQRAVRKPGSLLAAIRDWLPCVLILVAYRESGFFFTPDHTHRLDYLFLSADQSLFSNHWVLGLLSAGAPWLQWYLEFSYFLCYPLVPLGLGCLSLAVHHKPFKDADAGRVIDRFWTSVLLAVLFCYIVYPLFPLTPPRTLFRDFPGPPIQPLFRKLNIWVLGQYAVPACIFPSGHVAAVSATALAVRAYLPRIGIAFLVAAVSVAAATVYGRYHYTADALTGALVGLAAFLVTRRIFKA